MKDGLMAAVAVMAMLAASGNANAAAPADKNWTVAGQGAWEERFSGLSEITPSNVGKLGVAWYHEFDTDRGQEATPILVDGVLYVSTAWSKVYAFDAKTGQQIWAYDPEVSHEQLGLACCDAVNRGVAFAQGKIFVGAFDGRLIALDAKTGKPAWSVQTFDKTKPYTITGEPIIAKDKVIIGNGGADFGVRGYVTAYDIATGKQAWRFYTVPNAKGEPDGAASDAVLKEKAAPTWSEGGWKQTGGGGTTWTGMAYDPETDIFYFTVGNGTPHNYQVRSGGKGDNLFISSILAVRGQTGKYVWHYQENPAETWDYDACQPIMLANLTIDGKPRKVLMQAPKNGFFYVLDAVTGKLLSADPFTEQNWAKGIDLKTGRPIENPNIRMEKGPIDMLPGPSGGHGPQPWSYSPETGLVYIPVQHLGFHYAAAEWSYHPKHTNTAYDISEPDESPEATAAAAKEVWGELVAWDPVARKVVWSARHPYFLNGGTMVTKGGVVFQGTSDGDFSAYDAKTGAKLWSYQAGNGIIAGPMSYEIDGTQYVAQMVGYGGPYAMTGTITPNHLRLPSRLVVFKQNGTLAVPAYVMPERAPPLDFAKITTTGDVKAGAAAFAPNCMPCHGVGGGALYEADLHRSLYLTSPDAFKSVVLGGALKSEGMSPFDGVLSPADVENIRAYILSQARKEKPAATH